MMRFLRIAVSALFAVTLIVFSYFFISNKLNRDDTIPVITVEGDMLDVSIKATNEDLLKGVTAHDDKDGDITSKVIVESISKFTEKGVCKVTYAVCDATITLRMLQGRYATLIMFRPLSAFTAIFASRYMRTSASPTYFTPPIALTAISRGI